MRKPQDSSLDRLAGLCASAAAGGSVPSLCIGYQGDELAPEKSVAGLAAVLNSDIEISPVSWKGKPHSSWARNPVESVDFIENWLARNRVISQQ